MKQIPRIIFVTGTDTGVGKSVVSLYIMKYLTHKGYSPFYLKPFQTGVNDILDNDSDARFVYHKLGGNNPPEESVLFHYRSAKAPLFAARDQNETIDVSRVRPHVEALCNKFSHLVIEGAGGILVPVTESITMIDIIDILGASPVIVARAGLGTINHTLLTIDAFRHRNITPLGVVFNDNNARTPAAHIGENAEAITKFSGVNVAGTITHAEDFSLSMEIISLCDRLFGI
jgi:dethiobiotin synthetase